MFPRFSLEKYLILESDQRVNYLKDTFKDKLSEDVLDQIIKTDPHRNNIYTQWIINQFVKNTISVSDLSKVRSFLVDFDNVKQYLPKDDRDILKNFKLQPGVAFDNQPSVKEFNEKLSNILKERGLDKSGNFIGGDIIKKYTPTRFLVLVKDPTFCGSKAVESGWCLQSSDYSIRFTQKETGIFLMDEGVAQIACEYDPVKQVIKDIQGRFNKPWDTKYDRVIIDLLKYVGPIKDILSHKDTFWNVYAERDTFKKMVDALDNIQLSFSRIDFLRKQNIPIKLTDEDIAKMTPDEKLSFGIQLTENEIQALSIETKYRNDIPLTPKDKESLKGSLLGNVIQIIDEQLDTDSIKELFSEHEMPDHDVIVDEDGIGVPYSRDDDFYEEVYGLSYHEKYYLIQDSNIWDSYNYEEEVGQYVEYHIGDENIQLLKNIFTRLGRPGLVTTETPSLNVSIGEKAVFENNAIKDFFEEFEKYLKAYSLESFYAEWCYAADEKVKELQDQLIEQLPFGLYNESHRYNSEYSDDVNGLFAKWDVFAKFLGMYKSDVLTLQELFDTTPLIDITSDVINIGDWDDKFSDYHFLQEINLNDFQNKLKENLTDFLESLDDPYMFDDDVQNQILGINEFNTVVSKLGFNKENDYTVTKNGITIKIVDRDFEDLDNIKVKIERSANNKKDTGFVRLDNLYKYLEKTLFERKFVKTFEQFLLESKNLKKK